MRKNVLLERASPETDIWTSMRSYQTSDFRSLLVTMRVSLSGILCPLSRCAVLTGLQCKYTCMFMWIDPRYPRTLLNMLRERRTNICPISICHTVESHKYTKHFSISYCHRLWHKNITSVDARQSLLGYNSMRSVLRFNCVRLFWSSTVQTGIAYVAGISWSSEAMWLKQR